MIVNDDGAHIHICAVENLEKQRQPILRTVINAYAGKFLSVRSYVGRSGRYSPHSVLSIIVFRIPSIWKF